jgi:hypothetical protein
MIPDAAPTGYLLGLPALANYKPRKAASSASQFRLQDKQLVRLSLSIGFLAAHRSNLIVVLVIQSEHLLF